MKTNKSSKSKASKTIRKGISKAKKASRTVVRKSLKVVKKIKASPPVKRAIKTVLKSRAAQLIGTALTDREIRRMPESAYMNDVQKKFFKARLLQQRSEVLGRQTEVKDRLNQQESFADPADRATAEEEHWLDLRLRERESFLLRKIDDSLRRISEGEYGYCKVTGDRIGIARLLARPTAEVCVDVKGQNEHIEAQFRDR